MPTMSYGRFTDFGPWPMIIGFAVGLAATAIIMYFFDIYFARVDRQLREKCGIIEDESEYYAN